ncbi:MAG: hypothetical protein ABL891_08310 [Burkholderiales bacterium]
MNPDSTELPPLENLLVAALYLATNFAKSGCPRLSHMLLHQLEFVLKHPRDDVSPMIQETCQRLYEVWEGIHAERALAQAEAEAPEVVRRVH